MKLLKKHGETFSFRLSRQDKQFLTDVLTQYPLVPPGHHRLTRKPKPDAGGQQMLDEALAEQRLELRQKLKTWLDHPGRFKPLPRGTELVLTGEEIDWLLRMLNDVRVGCWIRLGSPDHDIWDIEPTDENAPIAWTMGLAGMFEAALLEAFHPSR